MAGRKPKYGEGMKCRRLVGNVPGRLIDAFGEIAKENNYNRSELLAIVIRKFIASYKTGDEGLHPSGDKV